MRTLITSRPWQQASRALAFTTASLLALGCGSGLGLLTGSGGGSNPPAIAAPTGPQLGYFWNSGDQTLRPILGIPGASQIGQSVVPAGTYATAAASSASEMALLQEPDGSLDALKLPSGQPIHLTAATPAGVRIRFSPDGKSALVFLPGSASLTLVTGLTSTPTLAALAAPFPVTEAALSNAASIAVATASSSGVSLQIVSSSGTATPIASVGALAGLAFAGADLVAADSAASSLLLVHNAATTPAVSSISTSGLLQAPLALGVSPDARWALVANSAEPSLIAVDLTAQTAPQRILCACSPAVVAPISGSGAFRVTGPTGGPLWGVELTTATAPAPRAFFIPSLPGMAAGKTGVQE
jgi:hypothetical protein